MDVLRLIDATCPCASNPSSFYCDWMASLVVEMIPNWVSLLLVLIVVYRIHGTNPTRCIEIRGFLRYALLYTVTTAYYYNYTIDC